MIYPVEATISFHAGQKSIKLYALDEVKEIFSVHGDVDLLVKVELTRDMLSSDAEVISHFVHERVRQLPGIIKTNTLIPGFSKIKAPPND